MKNIRHILTLMALWVCTTMQGQTGMDWNQTAMTALQMGNAAGAEEILRTHEQEIVDELGAFFYCSQLVSIGMVRHNQGEWRKDSLKRYTPYAYHMAKVLSETENDLASIAEADIWQDLNMLTAFFKTSGDKLLEPLVLYAEMYDSIAKVKNPEIMADIYSHLFNHYHEQGDMEKTIGMGEVMASYANEHLDSTLTKATIELLLGNAYFEAQRHDEAETWLLQSYQDFQPLLTTPLPDTYIVLLNRLTHFYTMGDSKTFALVSEEYLEACKARYGTTSRDYILSLLYNSTAQQSRQDFTLAVNQLEEAYRLATTTSLMTRAEQAMVAVRLNIAYSYLGLDKRVDPGEIPSTLTDDERHLLLYLEGQDHFTRKEYDAALPLLTQVLAYYEQHFNNNMMEGYYRTAVALSTIYSESGMPDEAERNLSRAISFIEEHDPQSRMERHLYSAKGMVFQKLKNYTAALENYQHSLALFEQAGDQSMSYVMVLNNLAMTYMGQERYSEAEAQLSKALDLLHLGDESTLKQYTNDHLMVVNNIGYLVDQMGQTDEAYKIYESIVNIAKGDDTKRGAYALAINNMAVSLATAGQYAQALPLLEEASQLLVDRGQLDMLLSNLVVTAELGHDPSLPQRLQRYNTHAHEEAGRVFSMFTEQERENYWTQQSLGLLIANNSAAQAHPTPEILTMAYDNALYSKTMLLRSNRLLGELAQQSPDGETKRLYGELVQLRRQLTAQTLSADSLLLIRQLADKKEKALIASIPDFNQRLSASFHTMGDVSGMLKKGEAAIEFVYLPTITSFTKLDVGYGALVLRYGEKAPRLVRLCDTDSLHNFIAQGARSDEENANRLYALGDSTLYRLTWGALIPQLQGVSTVYYSPTGVLNNLNHAAISDGQRRMEERWQMVQLSSTAYIEDYRRQSTKTPTTAIIYGGINYNAKPEEMLAAAHNSQERVADHSTSSLLLAQRGDDRAGWKNLPGTREEAEAIGGLMQGRGITTRTMSGATANEESFKALAGLAPDVIHIATHGFFFDQASDSRSDYFNHISAGTAKDQSMLYSGIVMAGANNAWQGKAIDRSLEDGILTAEEISHLDLSGARLVVLSACQTALGNVDEVDGVYGLQRGLKKAGAQSIVMSLWRVPDEATALLMTAFYEALTQGLSATHALRQARTRLQQSHPDPYSWAAFVVLEK